MPSQDKTGAILSRFPGPVTLYPSRTKSILILLGCTVFVAGGLFAMQGNTFMRWGAVAFFGTGMAVAIAGLLPGASQLKLDREGFEFTAMFRRHSVRWQAATGFEAMTIPPSGPNDGRLRRRRRKGARARQAQCQHGGTQFRSARHLWHER